MRKIVNKNIVIFSLILVLIISLLIGYKTLSSKKDIHEKYKTKNERKQFAMFIKNNENNQYETYEGDSFPEGYRANLDKSICTDINGNIIKGVVSNSEIGITLTSNKTVYCEIYLDEKGKIGADFVDDDSIGLKKTVVSIDELLYRYQGTNDVVTNNYICFGTDSKDDCISHQDKYMYRIIGIDRNSRFKIIKKTALAKMQWWTDNTDDIIWPDSLIYKNLNGSSFISNNFYISSKEWENKIDTTEWKYGDDSIVSQSGIDLLKMEMSWNNKTVETKIGLMYLSDYYMSTERSANMGCTGDEHASCKTSWLQLDNNDSNNLNSFEWTMSHYNSNMSWTISGKEYHSGAYLANNYFINQNNVRPVFYIVPTAEILGTGTIDDPFIITN